jgi:hypothetical protein
MQFLVKGNYDITKYFYVVVKAEDLVNAADVAEDIVLDTEEFDVGSFNVESIEEVKDQIRNV